MKNHLRLAIALLLIGLSTHNPALSDPPPGKGNPNKGNQGNNESQGDKGDKGNKGNKGNQGNQGNQWAESNSTSELALSLVTAGITAIAAQNLASNLGLFGYSPLPPGIAKNLARGKPLPPGIAKKYPPQSMIAQLPFHRGYEWRVAGYDLILVAIGTSIVADVLRNVFR